MTPIDPDSNPDFGALPAGLSPEVQLFAQSQRESMRARTRENQKIVDALGGLKGSMEAHNSAAALRSMELLHALRKPDPVGPLSRIFAKINELPLTVSLPVGFAIVQVLLRLWGRPDAAEAAGQAATAFGG